MKYSEEEVKVIIKDTMDAYFKQQLTRHDAWEDLFCEDDYDVPEECWADAEDFLEKVNNLKVTVIVEEK